MDNRVPLRTLVCPVCAKVARRLVWHRSTLPGVPRRYAVDVAYECDGGHTIAAVVRDTPPCGCSDPDGARCYRASMGGLSFAIGDEAPDMPAPVVPVEPKPCRCVCHERDRYDDDDPTDPGHAPAPSSRGGE